eukprot:gnl/MRDRNA2_/MRDRNA2_297467_c0_seq1.p2 gnl/MRDRNA2_/MRDRNA2_297467_c0~~gnl/MRDRNA2_/MRDRNA2_297467_c0_seq1.p2  ORF type:complete len:114 (-),score=22.66 gnl/MRDRNA2_/MRDRNA2_297467_c0_seq1:87-428(-)
MGAMVRMKYVKDVVSSVKRLEPENQEIDGTLNKVPTRANFSETGEYMQPKTACTGSSPAIQVLAMFIATSAEPKVSLKRKWMSKLSGMSRATTGFADFLEYSAESTTAGQDLS